MHSQLPQMKRNSLYLFFGNFHIFESPGLSVEFFIQLNTQALQTLADNLADEDAAFTDTGGKDYVVSAVHVNLLGAFDLI
jgi:hypothetical protein